MDAAFPVDFVTVIELAQRFIDWLAGSAVRRPGLWLAASALLTVFGVWGIGHLAIDPDLLRLLPQDSRASRATRSLSGVVGGTSYGIVLFEGNDPDTLLRAVRETAERVGAIPGVSSVEYQNPVDFLAQYRFLLIPTYYLERIGDVLAGRSTDTTIADAAGQDEHGRTYAERQDRRDIEELVDRYQQLPAYHRSPDGRVWGMLVRTQRGVTDLRQVRELYAALEREVRTTADRFSLWSGITGSLRNRIEEYDVLVRDLSRAGLLAAGGIITLLLISFRSLPTLLVVILPLGMGLTWSFGLVPLFVGELTLITSFLLVVTFGMGVDYAIHLVKRFRAERARSDESTALRVTYGSTGAAVIASGVTTAIALFTLTISDFRGFAEFGLIGGITVLMVLAAMFVTMPATLIVVDRLGGLRRPVTSQRPNPGVPGRTFTTAGLLVILSCGVLAVSDLRFDYDFGDLGFRLPGRAAIDARQRDVYSQGRSPGAVFVAPDFGTLDSALAIVNEARKTPGSTLGRTASLRDFAPTQEIAHERLRLLDSLAASTRGLRGLAMSRQARELAREVRNWEPPDGLPQPADVPHVLRLGLEAQDGSHRPLLAIYPRVQRTHGLNAMRFTDELYHLPFPPDVQGPVGETPVLAEILWLVRSEGPLLAAFTFVAVFMAVGLARRSMREAAWMMVPLVLGMMVTAGVMAALSLHLNFFNVVMIPALLGLGVDHGVHYYARWRETGRDVATTQRELFEPLTTCSATTVVGYLAMTTASHDGLRSIGVAATIGLAAIWFTSVAIFPGLLAILTFRRQGRMEG